MDLFCGFIIMDAITISWDFGMVVVWLHATYVWQRARDCDLKTKCVQVIERESWEHIRDEDIQKAVRSFHGEILQVPPMFSAIKV